MTKPIIVYRLGSLGDTVVALPCFNKIRACFPANEITVLTNIPVSSKAAPLASILQLGGLIDGAIAYPVGERNPLKLLRLALALRRLGSETLVYLQPRPIRGVRRDLIFFRLCGFKKIIGAPLTAGNTTWRTDPVTGELEFEAVRLARCLADLGDIDLDQPQAWDLHLTPAETEVGEASVSPFAGQPFIAVNMGGKDAQKDWGEANWAETLARVGADGRMGLVIVGAAEDAPRADRIAAHWPGPSANLCGKLAPRETAAVLRRATLFVGHDSGPLHLAAAVQTPCVGIFGDFNRPRAWHPYGAGHVVIHDMLGVGHITVQAVVDAVSGKLAALART